VLTNVKSQSNESKVVRLAILSDIHGNLVGLKAAIADLKIRSVEQTVCLGDVAAVGPQPREVIELLQTIAWPCVMGNTDETLAKNVPEKIGKMPEERKRRIEELDEWTRKQLRKADRDYISTFKSTVSLKPPNAPRFLCYHGSPRSNQEGIFATTPENEVTKYLENHDADIFAGGHTHTQMFRRFRNSIIVNPGSVGLPAEKSIPRMQSRAHAEYAIVTSTKKSFSLELCSVPYPFEELEKAVRNSGLPNPDRWISDW